MGLGHSHPAEEPVKYLGVLNQLGFNVVCGILGTIGALLLLNVVFLLVRRQMSKRLRGKTVGHALSFHSPDDTPRSFQQYPYKRTIAGDVMLNLWVIFFVVGYIWMMVHCWFVYPRGQSNSLGAPPEVIAAFGGWSGLVAPWLILFTAVHGLWLVIILLKDAMKTQFMLPVSTMKEATHVMIEEEVSFMTDDHLIDPDHHETWKERLKDKYKTISGSFQRASHQTVIPITTEADGTRQIEYTCVRYAYDDEDDSFKPQGIAEYTARQVHDAFRAGGLSEEAAARVLATCGQNEINVHVPSILEALVEEFMDFTKVVASLGTWAYMVYSAANMGLVWFCITFGTGAYKALMITRPNKQENARLAQLDAECEILRDGKWKTVSANQIVIGDVMRVSDVGEAKLPCDGILIEGSIVTNESMLTGEPMPVQKIPADDSDIASLSKKNFAYGGTKCLQSVGPSEGKAIMIASAVGALTTRGQLVRMVLFPTSVRFKYIDQLPKVYVVLFIYMCFLIFVYTFFVDVGGWVATYLVLINTCAMCLNPMLPVSVVMGQAVASARLKNELEISCLQPGRIPIAGKISTMVFDKTGTITKEGMDFTAVIPIENAQFGKMVEFNDEDPESPENRTIVMTQVPLAFRHALASCHTVTKMRDGMLVGNAVEVSMVRTCGWELTDQLITSPDKRESLEVVKKLDFDHRRMTSGVVVRSHQTGALSVFLKGSYEKIQSLSQPVSIPADYDTRTAECAKTGYYTLGVATKSLPPGFTSEDIVNMTRDELEAGLNLCGLLLFLNEMKPDSPNAMRELEKGSVRSVICTGDNALTGIAIGRKCGIVKSGVVLLGDMEGGMLVWRDVDSNHAMGVDVSDYQCGVTNTAWRHLYANPDLLSELWPRIVVFARMKPEDKINVVTYLQSRHLIVGMSGDGGNDCGGLRASHAGLALSDAEASMVSPFSSGRDGKSLMTVVDMIREGRACLTTNLATFRFFMTYCFILTGIRTWLLLYASLSMGEYVWLTNDIVFGIIMVSFMLRSRPQPELSGYRPTATLFGTRTLSAIAFPVVSAMLLMGVAYELLWTSDFYVKVNPLVDLSLPGEAWMLKGDNYDSTIGALFLFTSLSTAAFVNSYGGDFRRNIAHNWGIMIMYFIVLVVLILLVVLPPTEMQCLFRINCGTEKSLESGELTPFAWFSSLGGAGLVGGCFLGPMLTFWQDQLGYDFIPKRAEQCRPPEKVEPPYEETHYGCVGPNNCYSGTYRMELFIILATYVLANHFFVKFVLQGPVARKLRETQKRRDKALHEQGNAGDEDSSDDTEEDDESNLASSS